MLPETSSAFELAASTTSEGRIKCRSANSEPTLRAAILLARAKTKRSKATHVERAEEFLERAIEIAATQGSRLFGPRATVDLSRLWLGAGKRDEARQRLTEALAGFTEGFGEVDLRAASELLEKIDNEGA